MSDDWFSQKLYPYGDGNDEDGCHPEEARALKAYLRHQTTPIEAAQAITRPTNAAPDPKEDTHRLWGLLIDAFMELPREQLEPLVALIQAIEGLSNPEAIPNNSEQPSGSFWKESPGFGNLWSDMCPSYVWRGIVGPTEGARRDALRANHVRRAEVEARLVNANVTGITIAWGYEGIADALESSNAMLDFEVPAAAQWLVTCSKRVGEGMKRNERSWGLKKGSREPLRDLWNTTDDEVMNLERWEFWKERLRKLQEESLIVKDVRRALEAIEDD